MCGANSSHDHLLDQQQRNTDHFPVCGCCRKNIYPKEKFYVLNMITDEIIICSDCKRELDDSVCTVEDLSPLN